MRTAAVHELRNILSAACGKEQSLGLVCAHPRRVKQRRQITLPKYRNVLQLKVVNSVSFGISSAVLVQFRTHLQYAAHDSQPLDFDLLLGHPGSGGRLGRIQHFETDLGGY